MARSNHTHRPPAKERTARREEWKARTANRSGRMPITLIDASTAAKRAEGIQTLAASFHTMRPCYAQALQRFAAQLANSYTAAQAIANFTTAPTANTSVSEVTAAENVLAENSPDEYTAAEPPLT